MGFAFSSLLKIFPVTKREVRVLLLGLYGAGKTQILYKLKLDEVISTIPTHCSSSETLEHKNYRFNVLELPSQYAIRPLWHHYYENVGAVIFVVDSNDLESLQEASEILQMVMKHIKLENTALLVYANKQDLPNAADVSKITEELRLKDLHQLWHIHAVVATNGRVLWEGLDILIDMLEKQKTKQIKVNQSVCTV